MKTRTVLLSLVLLAATLLAVNTFAVPVLAQATPEGVTAEIHERAIAWFTANIWPLLVKLALIVGTARLLLKPVVEWVRGDHSGITGRSILNWLLSINTRPLKTILFCFLLSALCFSSTGCMGYTPGAITKQLKDDHATVSVTLVTPWGTQRVIRTNPGSNQTSTVNVDGSVTVTSK